MEFNPATGVGPVLIPIILAALVLAAMGALSVIRKKKGTETPDELHRDSGADEESGTES